MAVVDLSASDATTGVQVGLWLVVAVEVGIVVPRRSPVSVLGDLGAQVGVEEDCRPKDACRVGANPWVRLAG